MIEDISDVWTRLLNDVPNIIAALIILLVAIITAVIAKVFIIKLLQFLKFDDILKKSGSNEEKTVRTKEFVGKLVFLVVFMLWMPGFFEKLGLNGIASPIIGMMNNILTYIPNIIGAGVLLVVGLFIAKTVKELLIPVFKKLKIDEYVKKAGIESKEESSVAVTLATVVYVVILIPIIIGALNVLKIDAISRPSIDMLNTILAYIPKVAVAIFIFIAGTFIAKLAFVLLEKALQSAGLDKVSDKVFENTGTKVSKDLSLSKMIAYLVKFVIIILFVVQAFQVVDLAILTNVGNLIIGYLPYAVSAIIMMGLAILLANYAQKVVLASFPESKLTAMLVKLLILIIGVFITLYQLGIASQLVNSAFIIILGGVAVAFAIAFGVGGREFASHMLNKLEKKIDQKEKK